MSPSQRKGQERVKSQSQRPPEDKDWCIDFIVCQKELRRSSGTRKSVWIDLEGFSLPTGAKIVKQPPPTSSRGCGLAHSASIPPLCVPSRTYLRLPCIHLKGALSSTYHFGDTKRSPFFPLYRRIEVHSKFLLWSWLSSLVVAEWIEKHFNFHSIECV